MVGASMVLGKSSLCDITVGKKSETCRLPDTKIYLLIHKKMDGWIILTQTWSVYKRSRDSNGNRKLFKLVHGKDKKVG